ncbi:hypothetical protein FZC79_10845 [Rossellomorea vietnamensis]|uniref:Uncharacterized protein n=1 Tax=Rossellomorea vietnamensis TaxID=218284 RepID=A0A5D4KD57_9BACI|nr:hypothetical protein [Rossellomorea vietnamensis]TYR75254.1 hypothetical protein FZC79_10845 [Rossellomorea vietnamensis]
MKNHFTNFVLGTLHRIKSSLEKTNEGGVHIRYLRTKKFKKRNKGVIAATKLVVIWYALLIALIQFSSTNAALNDVERTSFALQAGQWAIPEEEEVLEESLLSFDSSQSGFCERDIKGFYSLITNGEDESLSGHTFELYYVPSEQEGPHDDNRGTTVNLEDIEPLASEDGNVLLKYEPESPPALGKYKFAALQPTQLSESEGVEGGQLIIWGEEILIKQEDIDSCWETETEQEVTEGSDETQVEVSEETIPENPTTENNEEENKEQNPEGQETKEEAVEESLVEEELLEEADIDELKISEEPKDNQEPVDEVVQEEEQATALEKENKEKGDTSENGKKDNQ